MTIPPSLLGDFTFQHLHPGSVPLILATLLIITSAFTPPPPNTRWATALGWVLVVIVMALITTGLYLLST